MRNTKTLALVMLASATALSSAQELLGAKEVIRRQNALKAKGGLLSHDVDDFRAEMGKMTSEQAGIKWADLLLNPTVFQQMGGQDVLSVLPPPASWASIRTEIEAKSKKPSQKLFGSALTGDKAGEVKNLNALITAESSNVQVWQTALSLAIGWGDYELAQKSLDHMMAIYADPAKISEQEGVQAGAEKPAISVPDLTRTFSPDKAKALYLRILMASKNPLALEGKRANKIAIELCRQHGSTFPVHHCELIKSPETADLYLLFNQWFPKATGQTKVRARAFYVLSKVIAGKGDAFKKDAPLLAGVTEYDGGNDYAGVRDLEELFAKPEIAKASWSYLDQALRTNPKLKLWNFYGSASFAIGKVREMIPVLRMGLAVPGGTARGDTFDKSSTASLLIRAVALVGTPEDVVKESEAALKAGYGDPSASIKLGKILGKPELIALALKNYGDGPESEKLNYLIEEKKYAEAESLMSKWPDSGYGGSTAKQLIEIYGALGRDQDVIDVLDRSSDWGVGDLSDAIQMVSVYRMDESMDSFVYVAKAFINLGKRDLGLKVLRTILDKNNKLDDAYELLIKSLDRDEAIKTLDELYSRDIFEERPLIWKAIVLQKAGKLDEAEKVARQAISVDPSDGDMGHGKRMLAYKVLSQILAAKGNDKDSKFFMSVVDAIRLSEKADDYLQAGLSKQAIQMYSDSLKIFSDAYCIQSRIAVNLANEGKTAEAIEHFKHAFELMPDSFGRVETHCFGCEGVFTTGPAEGIAETVLQDAAKKSPNKPQSQYLLGYLRMEQGRSSEALGYFKKAVALDPMYLNAWKQMSALAEEGTTSPAESENIILNIIRLDPQNRHQTQEFSTVRLTNFAKIYDAISAAKPPYGGDDSLYPLPASKAALQGMNGRMGGYNYSMRDFDNPASRLMRLEPLNSILRIIQFDGRGGGMATSPADN